MRNNNRTIRVNNNELYTSQFQNRGVNFISQFTTQTISYPTVNERNNLSTLTHIWAVGDRYFKLAYKHYGDPKFWWIIAWYNQSPTESHLFIGDEIKIPVHLQETLKYFHG